MPDDITKDDLLELLRNAREQCLVLQRQLADCAGTTLDAMRERDGARKRLDLVRRSGISLHGSERDGYEVANARHVMGLLPDDAHVRMTDDDDDVIYDGRPSWCLPPALDEYAIDRILVDDDTICLHAERVSAKRRKFRIECTETTTYQFDVMAESEDHAISVAHDVLLGNEDKPGALRLEWPDDAYLELACSERSWSASPTDDDNTPVR